jgi:hypothetical protein
MTTTNITKTKKKNKKQTKNVSGYTKKNALHKYNNKYNNKYIIVSHFNDNSNIYHIFACEIMVIWNESKGNPDTIIVLKNYVKNNLNNWRLSLLKSIYKNVYIHNIPSNNDFSKDFHKKYIIKNILNTKYYKFLNESFKFIKIPKSQHYIKMANIIKHNIHMKNNIKGNTVAFIYRTNNRILYDSESKELIQNILSRELKKLNIPFKTANFDNASFEEQSEFLKDVKILIACHGAVFTNLILLPQNASIIEVSFRRYWYCDPVCACHVSGKCSYIEDCHNRNNSINKYRIAEKTGDLIYHKADYYNLSQLFGIRYNEILIEDANGYFKNPGDKDYNPINLTNIYIDTNTMIDKIKKIY